MYFLDLIPCCIESHDLSSYVVDAFRCYLWDNFREERIAREAWNKERPYLIWICVFSGGTNIEHARVIYVRGMTKRSKLHAGFNEL